MNYMHIVIALVLGAAVAGCTHQNAGRVAADFGASHAAMLEHQYYDPEAARAPQADPPSGLDGQKGEKVIEAYRDDNSDREIGGGGRSQINILTGAAQ